MDVVDSIVKSLISDLRTVSSWFSNQLISTNCLVNNLKELNENYERKIKELERNLTQFKRFDNSVEAIKIIDEHIAEYIKKSFENVNSNLQSFSGVDLELSQIGDYLEMIGNSKAYINKRFNHDNNDVVIADNIKFKEIEDFIQNKGKRLQIDSSLKLAHRLAEQKPITFTAEAQTLNEKNKESAIIDSTVNVPAEITKRIAKDREEIIALTNVIAKKSKMMSELEFKLSEMKLKYDGVLKTLELRDKSIKMLRDVNNK